MSIMDSTVEFGIEIAIRTDIAVGDSPGLYWFGRFLISQPLTILYIRKVVVVA
jgi:hypothetical protein